MPWTTEKPFVMKMYPWIGGKPDQLFHATQDKQIKAFERDRRDGIYKQLWRGKGNSPDENTWETLEKWSQESDKFRPFGHTSDETPSFIAIFTGRQVIAPSFFASPGRGAPSL